MRPAIWNKGRDKSIWTYYFTGRGKRDNKSGTKEEALELKLKEVKGYPVKVKKYLDEQQQLGL
ncbi:hypothetical protein [Nannocystis sp.]|uniref:hypothetical protein n=1 Tax=Nannocystis sp. TaxID=1962667 RepID=UPI0025D64064|nr:hypothetical protein [Nannocystis sp.]MBK7830510.1 hypothetical protein [Nannocystis sp.]